MGRSSSRRWVARTSASTPSRTSSRPTPRSTPAIRAARWSTRQGNLIGINTAIYSRSGGSLGIGFAIPVSTARSVMEQIIQTGSVTRGWIGVEAQEITIDLAESFGLPDTSGALIAGVVRGSPADAAGIRPGDILLAVDGKPVKDPQSMLDLIASQQPGETVTFTLRRQTNVIDTTVKIGKRALQRRPR
jgi:S1-C subfamily serine protease